MKKMKKVIIILVVILVLCGGVAGGAYAYMSHQKSSLSAEVFSVTSINMGYFSDAMTSSGYVTNDYEQNIYVEDKTIKTVSVAEGDIVKVGDPVLEYDTTATDLQIEMKKLEIQGMDNDVTLAKRELEKLKKITPVAEEPDSTEEEQKEVPDKEAFIMQVEQKSGDAYNYIDKEAKPYEGDGTKENPYRFLCTSECYITGTYLNALVKNETVAAFEIWTGNDRKEGTLVKCWTVDGSKQETVTDTSRWSVESESEIIEEMDDFEEETEEDTELSTEATYTDKELKKAIQEKESDLKDLDIDKRKAELALRKSEKSKESSVVTASVNGVVKKVGDPENLPTDNSAFIQILGSEGLYVTGNVSELMLEQIKVGQEVTANSWNTGSTFTAKITEISEYPSTDNNSYGEGNSNVSYYPFTAYIEDATGLNNGDYVDLSINPEQQTDNANAIYLEKAYVRQENGKSYVLKVGEDDRLVKQHVTTGKTVYGTSIEIKSGLSLEDRIAFPYGKTAKEGIKAIDSSEE